MGTYPAVASYLEPRTISPRLFKSDCASERTDYGRFDLPPQQPAMPTAYIAWIFTGGPRPEKYVERGIQRDAALAIVCFDERLLRIGVHERDAGCAVSRELFAAAHHICYFAGEVVRGEIYGGIYRAERGEPARAVGQQP